MSHHPPLLHLTNVGKKYSGSGKHHGGTVALHGLTLDLEVGESLAVVGPSGSGKSTLLQLIGGLDHPTEGKVEVLGKNLATMSDTELSAFRNRTIGFVFQFFNLQAYFTARENVALPLILAGHTRASSFSRAEELLAKVGLTDRLDHVPAQLSGGEMQRVAVARALSTHPKLILADEPTANLDAANTESILELFTSIMDQGTSVIIITHDRAVAKRFPRQITLHKGKVQS